MTSVVLFHHSLGLTAGVHAFADRLRTAGHDVHVPDLYEGETFGDVPSGLDYAKRVGFATIAERGRAAAGELPGEIVYAGLSLGVVIAQELAQTRPGALGALLVHAAIPAEEFGAWPAGVPLQLHVMADDELGDVDVAQELAATVDGAELFLYPGDRHLFTDSGLADYDAAATALVLERSLEFLARIG